MIIILKKTHIVEQTSKRFHKNLSNCDKRLQSVHAHHSVLDHLFETKQANMQSENLKWLPIFKMVTIGATETLILPQNVTYRMIWSEWS